ncbi:MAG: tetratricopeptide repeat protein [Alphaproteobacteria bacterium]|nr:tetratricopeptide repeat protein [Alphaproteobacteria bacterium]
MSQRRPPADKADKLVAAGYERHQAGDIAGASEFYARALRMRPNHADALHLSGLTERAQGRHDEAFARIERACRLAPGNAPFEANRAAALVTLGRPAEALAAADAAVTFDARFAPGHANRAAALSALGREDEAAQEYQRALALDPTGLDALNNLANLEQRRGNLDAACTLYERALALAPHHPHIHSNYGTAIYALHFSGRGEEAARRAQNWLERFPDSPTARHWAAALAGAEAPPRAEDGYVRGAFDLFAATFDSTLASVGYRTPDAIKRLLEENIGEVSPRFDILDAGCGTGLAGIVLRGWAKRLEGVDISTGMLEHARARGIYDDLRASELVADLLAHRDSYDLIVAADVFCYFGVLDELLAATHAGLRPGGRVAFSTETMLDDETGDWKVRPSGRYAHARRYVEQAVAKAGFTPIEWSVESPRAEDGKPIPGLLVMAVK